MVKSQGIPSCSTNKSPSAARSRGSCHERDDILSIDGIDGSCSSSIRSLQPEANREADSWNTGCANLTAKHETYNIHGKGLRGRAGYYTRKASAARIGKVCSPCSRKGLDHCRVIRRRRPGIHCYQRKPGPAGIRVETSSRTERVVRQQGPFPAGHAEGGGARVGPDGIDFCGCERSPVQPDL